MGGGEATGPGAEVIQRIIFKPEARFDVAEAYEWYEQRDPGLGAEFMRAVDSLRPPDSAPSRNVSNRAQERTAGARTALPVFDLLSRGE